MSALLLMRRNAVAIACAVVLAGCATPEGLRAPFEENVPMVDGPAIEDIVTPFDRALSCLDGRLGKKLTFSVGAIVDSTGKEQLSDGGVGKFVTQGAGDIMQSALFQAGTTVLNRRDPRIMETETRWGLHNTKNVIPSMFFITGSINSLDFIPGGGFEAQVAGVGPRYRQHRILVGLDLSMTDTKTGLIVANVPLQKQIVASEVGFGIGRFFGDTLVSLDVGKQNREAMQFAMRQMLNLATFELLTQVMKPESYVDCRMEIQTVHGVITSTRASRRMSQFLAEREDLEVGVRPKATEAVPASVGGDGRAAVSSPTSSSVRGKAPAAGGKTVPKSEPSVAPADSGVSQRDNSGLIDGLVVESVVAASGEAVQAITPPPAAPVRNTQEAAPADTSAQRRYFSDEQRDPTENAVRALDLPVRRSTDADPGQVVGEVPPSATVVKASVEPAQQSPLVPPAPAPVAQTTAPLVASTAAAVGGKDAPAVAAKPYQDRLMAVETCTMPFGRHERVQAPKASKPGTMFFATGPVDTTLCVADADGKLWSHRFEKGKGRSFHGTPPFSLRSNHLSDMGIFFQGWKVPPVASGVDRIRLIERPLD